MIEPSKLNIFFHPHDRLRVTVGDDRSYPTVKPVWASPIKFPGQYLALLDAKEQEIATVKDPRDLPPASLEAVKAELKRRYLTATILSVDKAKVEFGATYWHVTTERGEKDFVTQSLQENAQWMGERHLLLIDVDGNRFEIPNIDDLDLHSRELLDSIV
ncbi:MAG: hypothetical protein HONBIEJF_00503 [Fimbriimonadaceae bacterium]|nr:hypothetical protein [Fimbriimonadaceae bacterium]